MVKGADCAGGRRQKERITMTLFASMITTLKSVFTCPQPQHHIQKSTDEPGDYPSYEIEISQTIESYLADTELHKDRCNPELMKMISVTVRSDSLGE